MVFSSLLFLTLFLPLTFVLYYLLPERGKNILLLTVSLIFYAWGEPKHIFLMLLTTFYTWFFSLLIEKFQQKEQPKVSKLFLILCLIFSFGTLAYFKYWGFLTTNVPFSAAIGIPTPALPIGISFYTFQAISYVIDVYRGDIKAQRNWINFAMYISLFPQLIAGPIVRYIDIEDQIQTRTVSLSNITISIQRFVIGLGKKVLLANQIGALWDTISTAKDMSMMGAWLGAIAFALQIYYDFSAYSDMAIGLGKMFGFHFTENFRYPYQSANITDFWRRWHMTLGTWFREYVYIPLGGNRKGPFRQILNLWIVWSLTGLWHGADWQFVLWGLYYFVFLVIEKFILLPRIKKWPAIFRHTYTLLVVLFGWVLFASPDLLTAGNYYKAMLGIGVSLVNTSTLFYLSNNFVFLIILCIGVTQLPKRWIHNLCRRISEAHFERIAYITCFVILFLCMVRLTADSYNPFLYFRF